MTFGEIDGFWWKDTPQTVPIEIKITNSEGNTLEYTFADEGSIIPDVLIETGILL